MKSLRIGLGMFLLIVSIVPAGCERRVERRTETRSVSPRGAERARVEIRMAAGELNIEGGARELMEGVFSYNARRWLPVVDYKVESDTGYLKIRHSRRRGIGWPGESSRNRWDIRLKEGFPLSLRIDMGAGDNRVDLRGIDVSDLNVDMGVGGLRLDLSGPRKRDLKVNVDGGVGSLVVYFPREIGVRVEVDGGLGSIHASGLTKKRHEYLNDAWGKSEVTIDASIDGGIGSIDLREK